MDRLGCCTLALLNLEPFSWWVFLLLTKNSVEREDEDHEGMKERKRS